MTGRRLVRRILAVGLMAAAFGVAEAQQILEVDSTEIPPVADQAAVDATPCGFGRDLNENQTLINLEKFSVHWCNAISGTWEGVGSAVAGLTENVHVVGDSSGELIPSTLIEDDGSVLAVGLTAAEAAAIGLGVNDIFLRAPGGGTGVTMMFQFGTGSGSRIGQVTEGIFRIETAALSNQNRVEFLASGGAKFIMTGLFGQVTIDGVQAQLVFTSGTDDFQMGQLDVAGEFSLKDEGTTRWYLDDAGNTAFGGSTNPGRPVHVFGGMRLEPQASPPAGPVDGDMYFDLTGVGAFCGFRNGVWAVLDGGAGSCA